MSEYRSESQTIRMLGYLTKHPGIVLSISYALLTLCGILYSASFYAEFEIAILKLANISDLLVTGLSEPAALFMFVGGILMGIGSDVLTQALNKIQVKWRDKPKSIKRSLVLTFSYTPKKSEQVILMILGFFALYAWLFVAAFADWQSAQIKQGHGDKVKVSSEVLGVEGEEMTLLGSTTNFVILYDHLANESTILPIENLGLLKSLK